MLAIIFGKEPFALLTSTSLHSNKKNTPIDDEPNNWVQFTSSSQSFFEPF